MFETILVPVNSPGSLEAIRASVTGLAKVLGSRLLLLTVVPPDAPADAAEKAKAMLAADVESFGAMGVAAEANVVTGDPVEEIVAGAAPRDGGLIAMATHHGSVLARGILGSVTDRVLHATTTPMLIAHPREGVAADPAGIGAVVVPLDGSDLGECAVPVAHAIAKAADAPLQFIRAVLLPYRGLEFPDSDPYPPTWDQNKLYREAEAYLEGFVQAASGEGIKASAKVGIDTGFGAAGPIMDALSEAADPIAVMCTHGAAGFKRWLVGSTTDKIVRASGHPVLMLPGQQG